MRFEDLKLIPPILKALREKNYSVPTPIQEMAIPPILQKKDILGSAQTGTGKTAAFAIPIIQRIQEIEGKDRRHPDIKSLILTPTRELAIQIDENIREYSKYTIIRHAVVYGGVKQGKQVREVKRGVHILVATPGRLLDLINQGFIHLDKVEMFVLDEADRMLDMGFIHDIRKIITLLPKRRQSLFFSATLPKNIIDLSRKILHQPIKIEVSPESTAAETVTQYVYKTNKSSKKDLLLHILKDENINHALLFSRTKHGADKIVRFLSNANIKSAAIHGNKAQNYRQKVMQQFKNGGLRVLVATDVASRGIDIKNLPYVINYDIPETPDSYVHRIGRTGRAKEEGIAISICEPEENRLLRDIEKLIKQKITVIEDNPFPQSEKAMSEGEKKNWNKEKQRRKQEFFSSRRKNDASPNGRSAGSFSNKNKQNSFSRRRKAR